MTNETKEKTDKAPLEAEILAAARKPDAHLLGVLGLGIEDKVRLLAEILRKEEEENNRASIVANSHLGKSALALGNRAPTLAQKP